MEKTAQFCLLYIENSDTAVVARARHFSSLDNARIAMDKAFKASDAILHFPVVVDDDHYTSRSENGICVCDGIDSYSWSIDAIIMDDMDGAETQS